MTIDFESLVAAPPSGRKTALILDHRAYAQQLLLRGAPVPWNDLAAYTSFFGQAQGLLRPDVALVDIGPLMGELLAADPRLIEAMSARSRTGFAFKTLMSDETLARRAAEFAAVVAETARSAVVLQVPSPWRWLAQTHELVGAGAAADISSEHAESMSVYLADWLRRFAGVPVSLLLLDGPRGYADTPVTDQLGRYMPVINAAQHYRWAVGLRADDQIQLADGSAKGGVLPPDYWWSTEPILPAADFLFSELPPTAEPETVLARLAAID